MGLAALTLDKLREHNTSDPGFRIAGDPVCARGQVPQINTMKGKPKNIATL